MPRTVSLTSNSYIRELLAQLRGDTLMSFPNPERSGCPGQSVLKEMALRRKNVNLSQLPVSHIASCSPCYREYMQLRKSAQHQRIAKIMVAVAASILLAVGAVAYWPRNASIESPQVAETPVPPPAPLATVMVNLASLTRTRGGGGEVTRLILPAKRFIAHVQMPVGSESGSYEVRVAQADNSTILETNIQARILEGITSFDIELPFDRFGGKELTLMVRQTGLTWQRYPIFVQ